MTKKGLARGLAFAAMALGILALVGCPPVLGGGEGTGTTPDFIGIQKIGATGTSGYWYYKDQVSVAVAGANVYMAWYEPDARSLSFAKSTDGGATWPLSSIVTVDATSAETGHCPVIALSGSMIGISYFDLTNSVIKFARSFDGGATWPSGSIVTVASAGTPLSWSNRCQSTAVDSSGNICMAYFDATSGVYNLKFTRSADQGATWSTAVVADSGWYAGEYNSIAVTSSAIYIAHYYSGYGLYVVKSTSLTGAAWGTRVQLDSSANTSWTSIAASGTRIVVAYDVNASGNFLKCAVSTDSGATWPTINTVSSGNWASAQPCLVLDGSRAYLSFKSGTNDCALTFATSRDAGATWPASEIKILDKPSYCYTGWASGLVSTGGRVYIGYADYGSKCIKLARYPSP